MEPHDVIHIGNDTAIPARFIAIIQIDQSQTPLDKIWSLRVFLTNGLPALVITFASEQEARTTFTETVQALEAYYAK